MNKKFPAAVLCLTLSLLVSACATDNLLMAPDTLPGQQLKPEYFVGKWCNNRDLTSEANASAGHSAIANLGAVFWRFREAGKWDTSPSGWMYTHFGEWQLEGLNTLIVDWTKGEPVSYQAEFKDSGVNLYLKGEDKKLLVMSRCD